LARSLRPERKPLPRSLSAEPARGNSAAVVGCEFVVAGGDAPTLLDLVEEPLDEITRAIQIGLKQIGSFRLHFGGILAHAPS
jgi:hypothetical protein